jgi:formylglycine-generating enzyme required for sulfatase activity/cephalosporin-C deacetylase-like acetyl esterase
VAAAFTLVIVGLAIWFFRRESRLRWAREQAIPQVAELVEKGRYVEAFALARRAEQAVPADPVLAKLWPEMSRDYSVETVPDGADVYTKEYTAGEDGWQYLGRSPVAYARLPLAFHRWRIRKDGFATIEAAASGFDQWPLLYFSKSATLRFVLDSTAAIPEGMVRVPGGSISLDMPGLNQLPPVELPDYFLDRTEVTNRQYKRFVDAGGYRNRKLWKSGFVRDGRMLSWEEAMAAFRDRTGRPGPSTWESGDYPEGQAEFPVTGVSWFEADAYAAFVEKSLPTLYHWTWAAGPRLASYIAPLSNFEGVGPWAVASHRGIGPYGTYDMAGNAKEWCWNAVGNKRLILGGAFSEPSYMFTEFDAQSPFDRAPTYGFRLVKYETKTPSAATEPIRLDQRNYQSEKTVSDEVFKVYKSLYFYDKADLKSVVESIDDSAERWRKEKVSFTAAYGNERVVAYLFIPRHVRPPYQTVVIFPSGSAQDTRSFDEDRLYLMSFLVKSGRALLYPIYKSTYERAEAPGVDVGTAPTAFYRDHVIEWSKDLGRSLDYIESRKDLDAGKIALYGLSWGARLGPLLSAVDERIRVALLIGGGLSPRRALPEADPLNFAPRVRQPTLMVNGRYDSIFPLDSSQLPLFNLLGTVTPNKRHVITESGHIPPSDVVIREALDWLDRYLGPVR